MNLTTRIVEYAGTKTYLLRIIPNMLHQVIIGQKLKFMHDGSTITVLVKNIEDVIYTDHIYRYIEVEVI